MDRPWEALLLRRPVRVVTTDGERTVDGAGTGGLAITPSTARLVAGDSEFFQITHIASGCLVGGVYGFRREAEAAVVLRVLLALPIDWTAVPDRPPPHFHTFLEVAVLVAGGFVLDDLMDMEAGHA